MEDLSALFVDSPDLFLPAYWITLLTLHSSSTSLFYILNNHERVKYKNIVSMTGCCTSWLKRVSDCIGIALGWRKMWITNQLKSRLIRCFCSLVVFWDEWRSSFFKIIYTFWDSTSPTYLNSPVQHVIILLIIIINEHSYIRVSFCKEKTNIKV
jgi:hypothetical protein